MKYLIKREEIAKAINFGSTPVLHIDLETPKPGWDDLFVGDCVQVDPVGTYDRSKWIRCEIHKYGDEPYRYTLMPESICLDNSFGYRDVMEMLKWAQAPVMHPGEREIVIEDYPKDRTCRVHRMKVSDRCSDPFTFPTCYLEEVEDENHEQ